MIMMFLFDACMPVVPSTLVFFLFSSVHVSLAMLSIIPYIFCHCAGDVLVLIFSFMDQVLP